MPENTKNIGMTVFHYYQLIYNVYTKERKKENLCNVHNFTKLITNQFPTDMYRRKYAYYAPTTASRSPVTTSHTILRRVEVYIALQGARPATYINESEDTLLLPSESKALMVRRPEGVSGSVAMAMCWDGYGVQPGISTLLPLFQTTERSATRGYSLSTFWLEVEVKGMPTWRLASRKLESFQNSLRIPESAREIDFPAISTRKDGDEEGTGTLDYRLRTWYAFGLSTLPCMDYQSPLEI
ncbi:hypothetical protein V1477_012350 [Vespula maculifrons]|uniref:Uncharacterized protein n=1 Tax=Vespula maculifrons TaxID=7453 RepID=A0ABD2BX82_VESMC